MLYLITSGRTHRSGQVHPPIYVMLLCDIPGERRLVHEVAGRLAMMNAITTGDRAVNDSFGLSKYVMTQDVGDRAATKMWQAAVNVSGIDGTIRVDVTISLITSMGRIK